MGASGLKLGLLGGTFNPIHYGHLRAAEEVVDLFNLDKMFFVPSARPPHKEAAPLEEMEHRLEMTRLAIADRPGFIISDLENRRRGFSYTIETLRQFHERYGPGVQLFFITGLDAFLEVDSWKEYRSLFNLADFVVITRGGGEPEAIAGLLKNRVSDDYEWDKDLEAFTSSAYQAVHFRKIVRLDISSTGIRSRLENGRTIRYLLPENVRQYIIDHNLYKQPTLRR